MHNEEMKRLEDACEEFLKTYAEDATARVSREAFNRVVEDICVTMLESHSECDTRHKNIGVPLHPLSGAIFDQTTAEGQFTHIELNFRTKEMIGVSVNRKEAITQMKGIPMGLDEEGQKKFAALFLVEPKRLTLSDIEKMGVKPHVLVTHMRKLISMMIFVEETKMATQPSGLA